MAIYLLPRAPGACDMFHLSLKPLYTYSFPCGALEVSRISESQMSNGQSQFKRNSWFNSLQDFLQEFRCYCQEVNVCVPLPLFEFGYQSVIVTNLVRCLAVHPVSHRHMVICRCPSRVVYSRAVSEPENALRFLVLKKLS